MDPNSSPQTNYANTLTASNSKLEQLQKQARNTKRQVDIDTIAKALENNYGSQEPNKYPVPKDEWFASGVIPKDPLGEKYLGIPETSTSLFNICANLEDVTPNQYCVKSKHSN